MTASSRGYKAAVSLIRSTRHPRICPECITTINRRALPVRHYAVAAATLQSDSPVPPSTSQQIKDLPPVSSTSTAKATSTGNSQHLPYTIQSGIVLSRPPLLTAPLHPFEESYFLYQKRLNERLALPFTRYFYYKSDTPADADWKLKAKTRNGAASRDIGGYQAYGEEGWNDEVLVGDTTKTRESVVESLIRDTVVKVNEDGSVRTLAEGEEEKELAEIRPLARETESDRKGDLKRLDRKLDRTLYLLVKDQAGNWRFPYGALEGRENLHQAAERILVQSCGVNMNTWIVGNAPVGHAVTDAQASKPALPSNPKTKSPSSPASTPSSTEVAKGSKTFFMKGRIMAGQADLKKNTFGLTEFMWLSKDEMWKFVGRKYWEQIRHMLADR